MILSDTIYAPSPARRPWALSEALGHDRVRHYSLARWALVEALKLARAKTVAVPEYICRDVLGALAYAGAAPVFYPLTPDLRPAALPRADASLAVNYFGFPQDLAPFEGLVIEDNAHGLLGADDQGRPLGTRAPLGILSTRKTLNWPNGGALVVNDASLPLPEQLPPLPAPLPRRKRVGRWLGARGALAAMSLSRGLRRLRTGSPLPDPDPEGEKVLPMPPNPCPEALAPVSCADRDAEVRRRRELYALCARVVDAEPVFASLPAGTAPYGYAFRAEGARLAAAERALAREGLFTLPWPDLPTAAHRAPHYVDVRLAHFLW